MPLIAPYNTRTFHRVLYATMLEKIRLLKRGDNQQQGTVTAYVMWDCRHSMFFKTGETIRGEMNVGNRCDWHLPMVELARVGVNYLNPLDRIVDVRGWYWQPEAPTTITWKLFQSHYCVACLRVDARA